MNETIIPICFALDEGYVMPTAVAMFSLLENYKSFSKIHFYLFVPAEFDETKATIIQNICNNENVYRLDIVHIQDSIFEDKAYLGHITYPTYFRLIMEKYIQYSKCIYLDGDILVMGNIADMYNFDIERYYIAGVKAPYTHLKKKNKEEHRKILGIDSFSQYVNAGVLLFNLELIRNHNKSAEFIRLLDKHFPVQDQDILNASCYPYIYILPNKYNVMGEIYQYSRKLLRKLYTDKTIEDARKAPVVYHFASKYKPWKYYGCRYEREWQKIYKRIYEERLIKRNCYFSMVIDIFTRLKAKIYRRGN